MLWFGRRREVPELNPDIVDRALAEAKKRTANLDYFFDTLSSPAWIGPLRERGLFSEPPPQTVSDEGYILAPPWSASRYLSRMASLAPAQVASVILSVETNNERVHQDFIDAALVMPVEEASAIAAREAAWMAGRDHLYYLQPDKAVDLATRLAAGGETETTIALIDSLIALSSTPRDDGWGLKRPDTRLADWEYDQVLRQVVEKVLPLAPLDILRELVVLLGHAFDLMRSGETDGGDFDLSSRVWRPRIADDRDRAMRAEHALVSATRDAARAIRAGASLSDSELVAELTARPEELLRRIAMDALARGPQPDVEVVHKLVVDPDALTAFEPSVEFRELLSANAPRLPRSDVDVLVAAIRGGPDAERYRERESRGRQVTDDEVEQYVAWWRAARLKLLLDALDRTERVEYEALVSVAGDAELPVSFEVHTFRGDRSPVTIEELEGLADEDILERLRTWEPEGSWAEPSLEGFARTLAAFIQRHPERIGALGPGLRHVRPAFVQWALEGLQAALRDGTAFDWAPVLDLMSWVVEQPREIPQGRGDRYGDLDPGWVWTRREIVSLLEHGLKLEDERAIALEHRGQVWDAIRAVAADPDPTPEHEERYGGTNMDPLTLALNTTRPRAIFAAATYGVWLHRALAPAGLAADGAPAAALFQEATELAELLEEHLDAEVDPSVAVRAAIAHFYANLLVLDAAWTQEHAAAIFPDEDSPLREAAWGAYVIYTPPYDNVLLALRRVYERSAELADRPGHGFRWDTDPRAKLGEHLATFYWRGTISLEDPLLRTYWQHAPTEARRHVIDFLGRSVNELPELERDVEARLLAFWDFADAEATRTENFDELAPFAWWFGSKALPVRWRLDHLLALLRKRVKAEPAFAVAEELPAVAEQEPRDAVEALRRLLELEQRLWSFDSWREQIEQVLQHALEQPEPDVRQAAEDTAHWLGALGYREYRRLLE
jgi:hypothetical protein